MQIHQWFKELRRVGRDPRNAVRIVRLEDLKRGGPSASQILNELTEWVRPRPGAGNGTAPQSDAGIDYLEAFQHGMKTNYTNLGSPKLSNETRDILDRLYVPHNKMLARLLEDERWLYERNDQEARPLVWPAMRTEDGEGRLFISPRDDDHRAPCVTR